MVDTYYSGGERRSGGATEFEKPSQYNIFLALGQLEPAEARAAPRSLGLCADYNHKKKSKI